MAGSVSHGLFLYECMPRQNMGLDPDQQQRAAAAWARGLQCSGNGAGAAARLVCLRNYRIFAEKLRVKMEGTR